MTTLLILADDFTGACDAAAAVASGARATSVLIGVPDAWPLDVDVLAVDLDLREESIAEAELRTTKAAHALGLAERSRVFLKIDSTLRGPIRGLIDGALQGSRKTLAVIAPAFPEQGRLLRDGRLVIDGQVGPSLAAVLNAEAVRSVNVDDHHRPRADVPGTAVLGIDKCGSAQDVERAIEHARRAGARHVIVDAESSVQLKAVAHASRQHPDWLLVGSAGLARQVAPLSPHEAAPGTNRATPSATPAPSTMQSHAVAPGPYGPLLIVAGSPAAATRAQLEHARHVGTFISVRAGATPPPPAAGHDDVVVLCTPPAQAERDAGECARAVADAVAAWSNKFKPRAVILAGGATARLVCERIHSRGVQIHGELAPGIPFGRLLGGVWDQVPVVTKAGGFGVPSTLLDAVQAFGVLSINRLTGFLKP